MTDMEKKVGKIFQDLNALASNNHKNDKTSLLNKILKEIEEIEEDYEDLLYENETLQSDLERMEEERDKYRELYLSANENYNLEQ